MIHNTYCCFSCLDCEELFPFADGATFAGVDLSDCENWIKTCMRTVTTPKEMAENVMPFHEEKREKHWIIFKAPKMSKTPQEVTTCCYSIWLFVIDQEERYD